MTATSTRRSSSRTARAEAAAQKLAAAPVPLIPSETPKPAPQAAPKPKPEPKPTATVDLGARQVTYYFPSAKLSDGTVVECPHVRYGHESQESARRCITALASQRGHRVS